ncbi:unnamed protein product [Scytosiphon promiscuus]
MNETAAAGAAIGARCIAAVVLFMVMHCATGWRCRCSLNPLPGLARDFPRHRGLPLQHGMGRRGRCPLRRRVRFPKIQDWSIPLAMSEKGEPAVVALAGGEGAVASAVDASGEATGPSGAAPSPDQGEGRSSLQRKGDRRQQRERRRMRLQAFEKRRGGMPAVESAVVDADGNQVGASLARGTAVDSSTIFAQRRGQLQQQRRRRRLPQSLEEEAAAECGNGRAIDDRYMRMALRLAEQARMEGEVPVGAVLVGTVPNSSDGRKRVLSTGRNDVERRRDASAHAEVLCLKAAAKERDNWRLVGATLYVTMEPCVMCLSAAQLFRVDRVVFGAPNPNLGACGGWVDLSAQKHAFHEVEVTGGVLADECALILRDFFRSRRLEEDAVPASHRPPV